MAVLPSWLKHVLRWLYKQSPLCRDKTRDFHPISGVAEDVSSSDFQYVSTEAGARFISPVGRWYSGWFLVEMVLMVEKPGSVAKLYFDTGEGFNESWSQSFPLRKGKSTKRLVKVPRGTRSIRLDPVDYVGRFSINAIYFSYAFKRFTRHRLSQRLKNYHPQYRHVPLQAIEERVAHLSTQLSMPFSTLQLLHYEQTFKNLSHDAGYHEWLKHQTVIADQQLHDESVSPKVQPVISILMPVYKPRPDHLIAAIDSVRQQSYRHWELCIADDGSNDLVVTDILVCAEKSDERIKVIMRDTQGHISAASNSALELASGEYIGLLDHDDVLASTALLTIVRAINANPAAELIYTDEDKLDEFGDRCYPHFKPDWNPDLLLSQNYICHFSVFRTERLRAVGAFRVGFEGSQDHDLLLRFTHGLAKEQIVHVPQVLYHWRASEGSTAAAADGKSYAWDAGVRAVADRCGRDNLEIEVAQGELPHTYRVKYPLPTPPPRVTLIIPTRDKVEILKPCLNAILERTTYPNYDILIIDNQSTCEKTLRYLEEISQDPRVTLIQFEAPFNFSQINNYGVTQAEGDIIGLINNDIEPMNAEWLDEMVRHVCRPSVGCVGAKLYYPNGTIQHGGVVLGIGGVAGHSHKYFDGDAPGYFSRLKLVQNYSAVTAACLLVEKAVFWEVSGLNAEHLAVAFNDVDFCLKVRELGYNNVWTPYAELYHHESVSRGADDTDDKRARHNAEATFMVEQWGELLFNDPAYNPNLSLVHEDFSLRF